MKTCTQREPTQVAVLHPNPFFTLCLAGALGLAGCRTALGQEGQDVSLGTWRTCR